MQGQKARRQGLKNDHYLKRAKIGIWDDLEDGKGRWKWYSYVMISENKRRKSILKIYSTERSRILKDEDLEKHIWIAV